MNNTRRAIKTCHFVSNCNSRISWSFFVMFVPLETGISTLKRSYKSLTITLTLIIFILSIKAINNTRNTFCDTWYLPHSRVHNSMAELCSNFGYSAITKGQIAYFSLRMHETHIYRISTTSKNLTSPSCSTTPISYMMQEFWRFG